MTEETSATIGSLAARGMRDPSSLTDAEFRRVCASALTQMPDRIHRVDDEVLVAEVVPNGVELDPDLEIVPGALPNVTEVTLTFNNLAHQAAKVIRSLQTLGRFADHVVYEQGQPNIVASEVVRQLEAL